LEMNIIYINVGYSMFEIPSHCCGSSKMCHDCLNRGG